MLDFTKAIEVAKDIYWVGKYIANDSFQCHSYLLLNGDSSVLIDPGLLLGYDDLVQKVESLTSIKNIKYIVVHHQDPDLCASIPQLENLINRNDLRVVTHTRTSALIKHYGIQSEYLHIDANDFQLRLSDARTLKFVTTPYAHAPGAFATYDEQTKTLFSSDIFGAVEESWSFYADENYFDLIKQFHQEYMPSREILNYALHKMEALELELILPQHGSIIQKKFIHGLIQKLKKLDCGIYINAEYETELLKLQEDLESEKEKYKQTIKHLQTIIDMRDNMIVENDGNAMIASNQTFLDFFDKRSNQQFVDDVGCVCNKFIPVDDERYLSFETAQKRWAQYILKHPQSEYRVLLKNLSNQNITFRVQVKELPIKNKSNQFISTFVNITKELEESDLLQSLSSFDDIHYLIYDKARKKYKISNSLATILNLPITGEIKSIQFKEYLDKTDVYKLLKSRKKDTDKFEIHVNYKKKEISLMIQSYISYIDSSIQHVYILVDISMIKKIDLESKQKDIVMFQQAKMAQMGEMISMIAHQWRQPINAISASSIKLSLTNALGSLESVKIEEHALFVQNQCQKMSQIIDSFMNYSNNRSEDKNFHICDAIENVNEFVSAQYTTHNIKINVEKDCAVADVVFGRKDMLEQVLLNLLSNSKDALDGVKTNDKYIFIKHIAPKTIIIEDNAGGIGDSIIDRLFTPYFTTKQQGEGTGLGLYMSKKIINEHFHGDLNYKKIADRSYFTITLGKDIDE